MNIIEFINHIPASESNKFFKYTRDDFQRLLDEQVPDWQQQVRNKAIWSDLYHASEQIHHKLFVQVILSEAGLELAYMMVKEDVSLTCTIAATDFCISFIDDKWDQFPLEVKDRILKSRSNKFIEAACKQPAMWNTLTEAQQTRFLEVAKRREIAGVSDCLLFLFWKTANNFEASPFARFQTRIYSFLAVETEIDHEIVENHFGHFDKEDQYERPNLQFEDAEWQYTCSNKMKDLHHILLTAGDVKHADELDDFSLYISNFYLNRRSHK